MHKNKTSSEYTLLPSKSFPTASQDEEEEEDDMNSLPCNIIMNCICRIKKEEVDKVEEEVVRILNSIYAQ